MMKVFVTKYALTRGILEAEGEVSPVLTERAAECFWATKVNGQHISLYFHKPYWHETREAAVAHAKQMRDRQLKLLAQKITKLKGMEF